MKIDTRPVLFVAASSWRCLSSLCRLSSANANAADAVVSCVRTATSLSSANAFAGNGESTDIAACSANKEQCRSLASDVSEPDI